MKEIKIHIPTKPKIFIFEEARLLMSEEKIKKFSKDYNFTYTLDYINARVVFKNKEIR